MITEQEQEQSGRRSVRLKAYDYSQVGGYYVTIVTLWRDCLFGEVVDGGMQVNVLGKIVKECWSDIPIHFPNVTTDVFVVMPNHVHGILCIHEKDRVATSSFPSVVGARTRRGTIYRAPTKTEQFGKPTVGSLPTIVRTFKGSVTRRAGRELNTGNIWQRNYYEHIVRDQSDYERIAGYILDNPLNWDKDEENPKISILSRNPPDRDRVHRSGY